MTGTHTSFLLDLKNRAVDHKFLNIHTEQSPEVPYATWRRFVYGSPQGSVMVSGGARGAFVVLGLFSIFVLLICLFKGDICFTFLFKRSANSSIVVYCAMRIFI